MPQHVIKKILDNGLTILIHESHKIPKVAVQLWYNVGSKDELLGEKGIAHLLEHMIFKGTAILSESDIDTLVHKLSGSCNAFTSYDYTGYTFNFPTHHWRNALPIIADCMTNCLFDNEMLNSEMKAVIQELKLNKDHYERMLINEMISVIFSDHPYHYPIIGYKQDLWSVSGKDLLAFYKKHYKPNNATLVVVGDVDSEEVIKLAQHYFSAIQKDLDYTKKEHFFHRDLASKSVTLYRDVAQPTLVYMFVVPGAIAKKDTALDILELVIGNGKSSRLYKKLVNEFSLATDVSTDFWSLFDHSIFFIMLEPKRIEDAARIERIIIDTLDDLAVHGIQQDEFMSGLKNIQMDAYGLIESIEDCAYEIGHVYLATNDENYAFSAVNKSEDVLKQQAQDIINRYFRPTIMHKGAILPLPESENDEWAILQERSDDEDEEILALRIRNTVVGAPVYAKTIDVQKPLHFIFPKNETCTLSNGLKVLYHNDSTTPKINIVLELQARSHYDPRDKQGLYGFVAHMMSEGTEKYSSEQLAQAIESRGMSVDICPGGISIELLQEDFLFGLDILNQILTHATFPQVEIEKIRDQMLSDINQYWDDPNAFVSALVKDVIYKDHPYSKQPLGTVESIASITRQDLVNFYKKYISSSNARIAVVGDLEGYNIQNVLETALGVWAPVVVDEIVYSVCVPAIAQEIHYPINRDQVVLCFAQLSIERMHADYDKYLLFDQIFGGGILGSMSSRLLDLRQQSGLFYTIVGSLTHGCDEQPGMFYVRTTVSLDRLAEAENAIKNAIDTALDSLTEQELDDAKRAIINT